MKAFIITFSLVIFLGIALLYRQHAGLEEKLTQHKSLTEKASLSKEHRTRSSANETSRVDIAKTHSQSWDDASHARSHLLEKARADLAFTLKGMSEKINGNTSEALRMIPTLLNKLKNLTAGEFIELAMDVRSKNRDSVANDDVQDMLSKTLISIAADSDPYTVLAADLSSIRARNHIKISAFETAARKSPQAAQLWLQNADKLPENQVKAFQNILGSLTLSHSPKKALSLLRDSSPNGSVSGARNLIAQMDSATKQTLALALRDEPNGLLRESLARDLFQSAYSSGDLSQLKGMVDSVYSDSDSSEKAKALLHQNHLFQKISTGEEADQMMTYLTELAPDQAHNAMTGITQTWSQRDLNATADWLQAQPVGPMRDSGIIAFAKSINKADPERSLEWADEVNNPTQARKLRDELLKEVE